MILQHAVFSAVMAITKAAIPDYALRRFFAVLVRTTNLSRRHAAAKGKGDVDGRTRGDVER